MTAGIRVVVRRGGCGIRSRVCSLGVWLIPALLLTACDPWSPRGTQVTLTRVWELPVSDIGLLEIGSAVLDAGGGGGTLGVLDDLTAKVVSLDSWGEVVARRRLARLSDGTYPSISGLDQGELILGSALSPACRRYAWPNLEPLEDCDIGPREGRRTAFLGGGNALLGVSGAFDGGPVFIPGRGEPFLGSFLDIENPVNSARLNWGIPFIAVGDSVLAEVQVNPLEIRILSMSSEVLARWSKWNDKGVGPSLARPGDANAMVLDTFPRVVGIAPLDVGVLVAEYWPAVDSTDLSVVSWGGRSLADTRVPLFFRPLAGSGELLACEMHINGPRLGLFRVHIR